MKRLLSKLGFGSAVEDVPHLVETASEGLNGAELAVAYFSGRAGGDFYEFVRVSPHRLLFGLLDIAGKRDDSRPILAAAQSCFRAGGAELFSSHELNEADAMIELARRLNREIMRAAGGVRSCPAFAGCYNEELGTVCYVNAGHTPGLLCFDSDVSELPATGMPFGLFAASTYEAPTAAVPRGGALLLASRGVVEAARKREEFGLERLKQHLGQTPLLSAHGVASDALQAVRQFTQAAASNNDLTTLALVRPARNGRA